MKRACLVIALSAVAAPLVASAPAGAADAVFFEGTLNQAEARSSWYAKIWSVTARRLSGGSVCVSALDLDFSQAASVNCSSDLAEHAFAGTVNRYGYVRSAIGGSTEARARMYWSTSLMAASFGTNTAGEGVLPSDVAQRLGTADVQAYEPDLEAAEAVPAPDGSGATWYRVPAANGGECLVAGDTLTCGSAASISTGSYGITTIHPNGLDVRVGIAPAGAERVEAIDGDDQRVGIADVSDGVYRLLLDDGSDPLAVQVRAADPPS